MLPPCSGGGEGVVDAPKKQAQLRGRGPVSLSTEKPGPGTGASIKFMGSTVPKAGTWRTRGRIFKSKELLIGCMRKMTGGSEVIRAARSPKNDAGLPGRNPEKGAD